MSWVASLGGKVQPKTIKQYLRHVKSMHTNLDLPFQPCTSPIIQHLIRGIKRYHGEREAKRKMPITLPVLCDLLCHLNTATDLSNLNVYAAACVAFLGFLQCGEFTIKTGKTFTASTHPTRRSIKFYPSIDNPTHARLNLPASKTDPFCKGISIYLAVATGASTCPVAAFKKLFEDNPSDLNGPLFHSPDRSPLTRNSFIDTIRLALQAAGYKSKEFSGHSFRRRAAAGCQDHEIQLLGWWLSDAYKVHIWQSHTPILHAPAHIA
ncbi:hypothetical protein H1R20_g11045, partial [Candolleomyces eurysporus]